MLPYRAFGYPFVALYIIVTTAICITLVYDTLNTGLGLGIVALGIPVYYFLMDKKRIVKVLLGNLFNSPCF
jgi:APA family basic amino acid/polyamine antiporter